MQQPAELRSACQHSSRRRRRQVSALLFAALEMSVVVQNSAGWFLDACSFIDHGHSSCTRHGKDGKRSVFECRFKRQCFRVNKSYGGARARAVTDAGMADELPSCDKPPKVIIRTIEEPVVSFCKQSRLEYCGVRGSVRARQHERGSQSLPFTTAHDAAFFFLKAVKPQ